MNINDALKILGLSGEVTKAQIAKAYKVAAIKYHPDRNPAGAEMMKLISSAYNILKDLETVSLHEDEPTDTNYCEAVNEALNLVINLPGLMFEVCGSWVWVAGNTKTHKTELKEAGFKWSKHKKRWYFRPESAKKRWHKGNSWSMDKIRDEYGSNWLKPSPHKAALTQNA